MPKVAIPPFTDEPERVHPVLGGGNGPCADAVPGDAAGLTRFGAHLERLPPGSRAGFRHGPADEDGRVHIVAGEVWRIEGEGTLLRPGEAAARPAGAPVGSCLGNRSARDALCLVVGTPRARDTIHHPDHELVTERDGALRRSRQADGRPRS